jgi:hypothetical protein
MRKRLRVTCNILVGTPELKRGLGNLKVDSSLLLVRSVVWIQQAQDTFQCRALVNMIMNSGFIKWRHSFII